MILKHCLFVDSVRIFENEGYRRHGLDTLRQELNIKRTIHSALGDVRILKSLFDKKPELLDHPYGYSFKDIVSHLNGKLPISIQKVFDLALKRSSYAKLESILFEYVKKKTAFNMNQLTGISRILICFVNIFMLIYS